MKYGEKYNTTLVNQITKERIPVTATYRRVSWEDYHTDNGGDGLWIRDKQILGSCDFTVCGCNTEKAAKAKIRNYVKKHFETFIPDEE